MKSLISILFLGIVLSCSTPKKENKPKYNANWESLAKHNEAPEWFRDAKLGIYFHWGIYSVPAFKTEWYPRHMHFEKDGWSNSLVYKHHLETYGHPSEFGYHDFVPLFKAEYFDAEEWADLFVKAGARFAGPVAIHHDGFAMWDSDATPWNSVDKGPKKDITGLLKESITKRGLKFITTFHHAKNLQRYHGDTIETYFRNSHFPLFEGMPTDTNDPELKYMYGNLPEDEWNEKIWFGKLKEVINKYQPDIIWFDSWLDQIPEEYRQKFCAYYLNEAEKWDKEVVIVRKQDDLPLDCSVDDLEKSRKNNIEKKVWMTDETVSMDSWCYTNDLKIKYTKDVLHVLIDIVSKNGVLLLNVSPMANGIIPNNQKQVLLKMGEWLEKYGESIYGTRPWYTFGEGPTKEPVGHYKNHEKFLKIKYSEKDFRFTTKGNNIYVSQLGWAGANHEINLKSFALENLKQDLKIKDITMLGSTDKVKWTLEDDGLKIVTPEKPASELAVVYKIETK